ncbi:MAG: hypothetical protein JKY65_27850 [Planctomycetes bacterium]|nr:hypothetical protein [Planctomycetota bacterium]
MKLQDLGLLLVVALVAGCAAPPNTVEPDMTGVEVAGSPGRAGVLLRNKGDVKRTWLSKALKTLTEDSWANPDRDLPEDEEALLKLCAENDWQYLIQIEVGNSKGSGAVTATAKSLLPHVEGTAEITREGEIDKLNRTAPAALAAVIEEVKANWKAQDAKSYTARRRELGEPGILKLVEAARLAVKKIKKDGTYKSEQKALKAVEKALAKARKQAAAYEHAGALKQIQGIAHTLQKRVTNLRRRTVNVAISEVERVVKNEGATVEEVQATSGRLALAATTAKALEDGKLQQRLKGLAIDLERASFGARVRVGEHLIREDKPMAACNHLAKLVAESRENPERLRQVGEVASRIWNNIRALADGGDVLMAAQVADHFKERFGMFPEAWQKHLAPIRRKKAQALLAEAKGKEESARSRLWRQAALVDPTNKEAKARVEISELSQATKTSPFNVENHVRLGMALDQVGDTKEAAEEIEWALQVGKNLEQTDKLIAYVRKHLGRAPRPFRVEAEIYKTVDIMDQILVATCKVSEPSYKNGEIKLKVEVGTINDVSDEHYKRLTNMQRSIWGRNKHVQVRIMADFWDKDGKPLSRLEHGRGGWRKHTYGSSFLYSGDYQDRRRAPRAEQVGRIVIRAQIVIE